MSHRRDRFLSRPRSVTAAVQALRAIRTPAVAGGWRAGRSSAAPRSPATRRTKFAVLIGICTRERSLDREGADQVRPVPGTGDACARTCNSARPVGSASAVVRRVRLRRVAEKGSPRPRRSRACRPRRDGTRPEDNALIRPDAGVATRPPCACGQVRRVAPAPGRRRIRRRGSR